MKGRPRCARGQATSEFVVMLGSVVVVAVGSLAVLSPSLRAVLQGTTECVISDVCNNGAPSNPIPVANGDPPDLCSELRIKVKQLARGLPNEADVIGRELALIDQSEADAKPVSEKFVVDLLKQQIDEFLGQFGTMRSIARKTGSKKLTKILYTLNDTETYLQAAKAGYDYGGGDPLKGQNPRVLSARIHDEAIRLNALLVDSGIADEVGEDLSELLGPAGKLVYKSARVAIDATYAFGQVYFDEKSAKLAREQMEGMIAHYNNLLARIEDLEVELARRGCRGEPGSPVLVANCDEVSSAFWRTADGQASYQRVLQCDARIQDPAEFWGQVTSPRTAILPKCSTSCWTSVSGTFFSPAKSCKGRVKSCASTSTSVRSMRPVKFSSTAATKTLTAFVGA